MIVIMRGTLQDRAPTTYYGQWPGKNARIAGRESPSIAHNEGAACAKVEAFYGRSAIFFANRLPSPNGFISQFKKNSCAGQPSGQSSSLRP